MLRKHLSFSLFLILLLTALYSCKKNKAVSEVITQPETEQTVVEEIIEDGEIEIVIVQINDVYEIAPLENGKVGGMARVAQLVADLREENPNTMLVHAGDFLNPSLIGTLKMDGEKVRGKQMIEVMNSMNFDLVAFGNHEFDLKYPDLQKRLNESNFQWIGTNVQLVTPEGNVPFYSENGGVKKDIPTYVVRHFKDEDGTEIDLGFVSACINSNPKDYVYYGDFYEDGKLAFAKAKSESDLVLGLTHLSLAQDKLFSRTIPEIPLIMGGHEHHNMDVPVDDARITKADANVKSVYIHRITYSHHIKSYTIESQLLEINETFSDEPKTEAIVNKWMTFQNEKLMDISPYANKVILQTNDMLDGRDTPIRSKQTNLGELIAEAMYMNYGEVDCAFVNGGSIRFDDQLTGDVTGTDIFRVLPYGGGVLKVKIKGDLLRDVLNTGELKAGTGAYLQRFKAKKDGSGNWLIGDQLLDPKRTYSVAVSDYLMKGLDISILKDDAPGVINVYRPKEDEPAFDIRNVVINHMLWLGQ